MGVTSRPLAPVRTCRVAAQTRPVRPEEKIRETPGRERRRRSDCGIGPADIRMAASARIRRGESRAKPGGQKAGAISAHLPLRVRISPGGHSAGAFGRHLPSWVRVSPDGQAGGRMAGSHLPVAISRFAGRAGRRRVRQAPAVAGSRLARRASRRRDALASTDTRLARRAGSRRDRGACALTGERRARRARGRLMAGGGTGATRIGTQAPCRSWVSPGAHGLRTDDALAPIGADIPIVAACPVRHPWYSRRRTP